MLYREIAPPAACAVAVECIWTLEGRAIGGPPETVVPDGCTELIVHLADRFRRVIAGGKPVEQPEAFLVGPMTRPLRLGPPDRVRTIGIRFRPGGAAGMTRVPMSALTDSEAPLDDLVGTASARRLAERLADAGDDAAVSHAVEALLREVSSAPKRGDAPLRRSVAEILRRRGNVEVERLTAVSGLSRRTLERRFDAVVGMSPKRLARIVRFQRVFREARSRPRRDWVEVALRCGYADQSHLIRDFRELSGEPPTVFLDREGDLSRRFTSPERLERFFAGA